MSATNDLDMPTTQRNHKQFTTLSAAFALHGWELIKGDPAIEGQAPYLVTRWGVGAKPLESLESVGAFLSRLSEAGHGRG